MTRTILQISIFAFCISSVLISCFPGNNYFHWNGKTVLATYSGNGHSYVALALYKDATFRYMTKDDMLGIGTKRSGTYLKTDTSITLFRSRSSSETFRIRGEDILMFPPSKEHTADSSFYRDYYTLSLEK